MEYYYAVWRAGLVTLRMVTGYHYAINTTGNVMDLLRLHVVTLPQETRLFAMARHRRPIGYVAIVNVMVTSPRRRHHRPPEDTFTGYTRVVVINIVGGAWIRSHAKTFGHTNTSLSGHDTAGQHRAWSALPLDVIRTSTSPGCILCSSLIIAYMNTRTK